MDDNNFTSGDANDKSFFNISKKTKTINTYEIYLNQSIKMTENLYRLLEVFRHATKNDVIKIYINSPGGRMDTTLSILHAMDECKAKIITIADGKVASAATFIFLAGDERKICDFAYFMFHQYSGGVSGKGHEMREKVDFTYDHYEKFFKFYYGDLFTDDEIEKMLYGKDKWIDKEGMLKLLEKDKEEVDKE